MSDDTLEPFIDDLVVGATNTNTASGSVYVVTCRRDGAPHSCVEAVYTTEAAAEEHKQWLADNSFAEQAIAWGVHEKPVKTEFSEVDE